MIFASIQTPHWLFESSKLFWIVVLVSVGALAVLVGVAMEVFWEKHWYKNLTDFRRSESIGQWGGRLVVLGLVWEVVVGAGVAVKDELENRATIRMVAEKTPRALTLANQRGLASSLSLLSKKPKVHILLNEEAFDAENLGNQLFNVFSWAGFPVSSPIMRGVAIGPQRGIIVGQYGSDGQIPKSIAAALKNCGLDATNDAGEASFSNELFILIQKK